MAKKQSTLPAGLASYRPAVDDRSDTLFHVYGVSTYGELLGLGSVRDGLDPVECIGLDAVREVVRTKTHGWDVAGPRYLHEFGIEDPEHPLAHGLELPMRQPVRAWRVVDVDAAGGVLPAGNWLTTDDPVTSYEPGCTPGVADARAAVETWVLTGDGPKPLSAIV